MYLNVNSTYPLIYSPAGKRGTFLMITVKGKMLLTDEKETQQTSYNHNFKKYVTVEVAPPSPPK